MGERPGPSTREILRSVRGLPASNVWERRFCSFSNVADSSSPSTRYSPEGLIQSSSPVQRVIKTITSEVIAEGWENQEVRVTPEDYILAVFTDPNCELPWTTFRPSLSFVRPECRGKQASDEFCVDEKLFDEALGGTNYSALCVSAVINYYEWKQRIGLCSREERKIYQPGVVLIAMKLESLVARLRMRRIEIGAKQGIIRAGKDAEEKLPDLFADCERIRAQIVENPLRIK